MEGKKSVNNRKISFIIKNILMTSIHVEVFIKKWLEKCELTCNDIKFIRYKLLIACGPSA